MLTNSFNVHETVNQNMNPQHAEGGYLLGENFHTQEFTTMNNLEENISIQWTAENKTNSFDPDMIVKTTKLRIEAAEFVPRCLSAGSTNINVESANVDHSAVYNSASDYNSVPSSGEFNKLSWADEAVPENVVECLPSLNSEYNAEVTESVPIIPEPEFINPLNTVPTRSFEEFVVTNINFTENEQVDLNRVAVSVDQTHTLGEINTNKTEFCIEETNQNIGKEHISDGYNRNFQPRPQYNRNWKRNVRSDDSYRQRGKPRYSQSFRENSSRGRNEEQLDYGRTNNNKQENESSYRYQENDNRPNRRYSDKAKNQDWNHGYDRRKNYQRNSLGSTSEVKHKEEIPQSNESTEKEATLDQTGTTDAWKSSPREHYSKNQFRQRRKEPDHNDDEDTVKRKWSERQSFGNKEVEELKNEEKGAKSKNQFRQSRKESEHVSDEDTVKRKWSERQSFGNKEVDELKYDEKGAKPRNRNFHKSSFTNSNSQYKKEGFDDEKHKKERTRRSFDSLRTSKYKTKDYEDENKSYRRSLNNETEKRPEKSFRDALFSEKKINNKPRDLKQERGSRGEKTFHYQEDYRYRSAENIEHLFDKKYAEFDAEYKAFLQELTDNKTGVSEKIKEQNEDLFKMPKDYSLAHCVAEDMRMGSGIAVMFRNTFSNVDSLLQTRQKPGGLAVLKEGSRFLYYLVTKKRSRDKPSYKDFWCSMKRLREHIKKYQITKLAVPTLGCGLDQLHWPTVKHMMGFLFKDVPIEIAVCHFSPTEEAAPRHSVKINRKYDNLKNAKESIIVYFISADSHVSDEMLELNKRFSFLDGFKKSVKQFGGVVQSKVSDCLLCGCVVRKTIKDPFSYKSFTIALNALNGIIEDNSCDVIALQCLKDEEDDLLHQKIITLIVNYLKNVDVNVYIGDSDVSFGET